MYHAGLVLEGGGMKGLYTSGVLDYFMDQGLMFDTCYGVSAGAINMVSYISKQRGRTLRVYSENLNNWRYLSIRSLILTGDIFGADFCYRKIPEEIDLFDYEEYLKYEGKAYAVVTNIKTGKPEYIHLKDMKKDMEALRASGSLPLVSRNVRIGDNLYLDGGVTDFVPFKKAMADGLKKNVVIMTKEAGYKRKPAGKEIHLIRLKYRKYPELVKAMEVRHKRYNAMLKELDKEEAAGNVFVIRPKKALPVGRLEKDVSKLKVAYDTGYQDAKEIYPKLMEYLLSAD